MNLKLKWDERKMKKTLANFDKYSKDKQKAISNQIAASSLTIQSNAKKNTPVDTGRLRASINSDIKQDRGTVLTNVEYASFIEFGTARMRAKPFLFPAWNQERPIFLRKMREILRKK